MRRVLPLLLLLLLFLAGAAQPLPAQEVRTAVLPSDITVGDVFHAVIRVSGAGERGVAFPDSLVLPEALEAAGRRVLRRDTVNGALAWTALYPLTAWRTGAQQLPEAEVQVADAGSTRTATAAFPSFEVRSVLPADTAGIEPKPARDVLGANRVWWPLALALLLLLLLAAAVLWYLRRRRARQPAPVAVAPLADPRTEALRTLDAARRSGALQQGDLKRFYSDVSEALRTYLAALEPQLGLDLTTTELEAALRTRGLDGATAELRRVLHSADLVKFARREPSLATAEDEWQRARQWVDTYPPAAPEARAA